MPLPSRFADRNLQVQGFQLTAAERRRLAIGLRFATGLCLTLIAVATALRSPAGVGALAVVGAGAGWSSRHPFDLLWNGIARRLVAAPPVPPTPARRRHAFKLAAAWLAAAAVLLATGQTAVALGALSVLLVLCALQTATYLCVPSLVLAAIERTGGRRTRSSAA